MALYQTTSFLISFVLSRASAYKFIFLWLTVDIQHKKHETETDSTNYFYGDLGWREGYIFRKDFMFSL